jgi:hypothetical protein
MTDASGSGLDEAGSRRLQRQALAGWSEASQLPGHTHAASMGVGRTVMAGGAGHGVDAGMPSGRRHGDQDPGSNLPRIVGTGLLVIAVIAAWMWATRPDPALDELMRLDVLSQMAAGEM